MKLALDHHYSTAIATELRRRGHDVVAAVERDWQAEGDESLLERCTADERALLTNNVGDFTIIARRWAVQGRTHSGLVFTSEASMPRGRSTIGRYVDALDRLLRAHPGADAMRERIAWL